MILIQSLPKDTMWCHILHKHITKRPDWAQVHHRLTKFINMCINGDLPATGSNSYSCLLHIDLSGIHHTIHQVACRDKCTLVVFTTGHLEDLYINDSWVFH